VPSGPLRLLGVPVSRHCAEQSMCQAQVPTPPMPPGSPPQPPPDPGLPPPITEPPRPTPVPRPDEPPPTVDDPPPKTSRPKRVFSGACWLAATLFCGRAN
jgi:hypothetical protein